MLVGRSDELAVLTEALTAARAGRSSTLVVSGEAGIGKSALLAHARQLAGDGLVLTTAGVEGESEVPYVNLADVMRPVQASLAEIPERQAAALASVLAIGPPAATDRFAVAAAALNVVGAVAAQGPVMITIDDAHWLDQASLEVLAFVARRLHAEGVVLIFGVRVGGSTQPVPQLARLPTLRLGGLSEAAARQLVAAASTRPLSETALTRLLAEAAGNPLALLELPNLLTPPRLALWTRGLEPLPLDSLLEQAFGGSIRYLPAPTRKALLLLATLGRVPPALFDQALGLEGLDREALEPAEEAGLITDVDGSLEFRHPLVRSAIYQTSTGGRRRRAHLRAAEVLAAAPLLGALERRAWHLIAAGEGADESLAHTLEEAASAEAQANNFAVASTLFERSAQLTPRSEPGARRLVRAADCLRMAGDIEGAYELLKLALPMAEEPALVVAIRYYLLRLAVWRRDPAEGRNELARLAATVETVDPAQASEVWTDAALVSAELGQLATAGDQSARALALAAARGEPPSLSAAVVRALVLAAGGEAAGALALLAGRSGEIDALDPLTTDLSDQLPLMTGLVYLTLEHVDRAAELLDRAVSGARRRSAAGVLPFRLGRLACLQFWRGQLGAARATAHEALTMAEDTGWVSERPNSLTTLARIEAVTGREEECRQHTSQALSQAELAGTRPHLAYAHAALGLLELSRGQYRAAIDHFETVTGLAEETGLTDSPLLWWSSDLVEAYLHEEMVTPARETANRLAQSVVSSQLPTGAAVIARCRALLEPADYQRHLREALHWHAQAPMPLEQARTELLLGARLRRARQRGAAQQHLSTALSTFERLGVPDWAERTRVELRALGVSVGAADGGPEQAREGVAQLTPQELQVALAVARGLANREVAAELFLSVKTVEFHLSHVFHKLHLNRRAQLAAMLAA